MQYNTACLGGSGKKEKMMKRAMNKVLSLTKTLCRDNSSDCGHIKAQSVMPCHTQTLRDEGASLCVYWRWTCVVMLFLRVSSCGEVFEELEQLFGTLSSILSEGLPIKKLALKQRLKKKYQFWFWGNSLYQLQLSSPFFLLHL